MLFLLPTSIFLVVRHAVAEIEQVDSVLLRSWHLYYLLLLLSDVAQEVAVLQTAGVAAAAPVDAAGMTIPAAQYMFAINLQTHCLHFVAILAQGKTVVVDPFVSWVHYFEETVVVG